MEFKDTDFGDLTNLVYDNKLDVENENLISLKGCPKEIKGYFDCSFNKLTTLEYSPTIVNGNFFCNDNKLISLEGRPKKISKNFQCKGNFNLKNIKQQIIKYQIKAEKYQTDEGTFDFEDIKEEFEKYGDYLLKKEEIIKNKIIKNKQKKDINIKNIDYGLSI